MQSLVSYSLVRNILLSSTALFYASVCAAEITNLDRFPIPSAASEELQNAIKQGYVYPEEITANKPTNEQEWQELIETVDGAGITLENLEDWFGIEATERNVGGVLTYELSQPQADKTEPQSVFLYLHGGAYVFNSGPLGAYEGALIAASANIKVIAVDYRMPPSHPYPAALNDAIQVYKSLLNQYPANKIAIGGSSAGAGLSMAALQKFQVMGLPMPGALYAGSPWSDLSDSSDTLHTLDGIDRVLNTYDGWLEASALLYANGTDLKTPYLSPIYGSFENYPPTYLVSGTRDLLLSDTLRTHRKLLEKEIPVEIHILEGLSHVEYTMIPNSPEGQQVYQGLAKFLKSNLK
ncbi:alpha/beta hydrolase [Vibrio sp. Isolate23]|uniref:alpha/beta hydrolase n=1 Tax=Vibrio sp. Isolate23 TaxID=2908533 RepID=UPI001EFCA1FC|nr:alpha/beta hydrolase [Vibrio sp. Isolate23]MCG9681191.1 alpha/beta hydrolase [Vibrio sp. Isolate23]